MARKSTFKMKDIEKLFEEKLKKHQVVPPAQRWEKLHEQLHGKQKKLTMLYWKIAASILVFMGAVVVAYVYLDGDSQPSRAISDNTVQQALPETKTEDTSSGKDNKAEERESISVEQQPAITEEEEGASDWIKKEKLPPATNAVREEKVGTETLPDPYFLAEVPKIQSATAHALATREQAENPAAVIPAPLHEDNPPIKIIYKGAKPQEKNSTLEKTLAFLDHLKSTPISFSELRQAKDELITRAFSFKDNEEARP